MSECVNEDINKVQSIEEIKNFEDYEQIFDEIRSLNINNRDYITETELKNISGKLKIASINIRSLQKNEDKINSFIQDAEPDIIGLQEIWEHNSEFDEYTLHEIKRKTKRGGGVAILTKKSLEAELIDKNIEKDVEYVKIKIKSEYFISVYVPPTANRDKAFEVLRKVVKKGEVTYCMGDFNIDMLIDESGQSEASPIEKFHSFNRDRQLMPLIYKPTRITQKSVTLIDNILTNSRERMETGVLTTKFADHLAPFLVILKKEKKTNKKKNVKEGPRMIKIRVKKEENYEAFNKIVKNINWKEMKQMNDPDNKVDNFQNEITKKYNEAFPIKKIKFNKRIHMKEEWMTRGILISMNNSNKQHEKWVKKRNPIRLENYRTYNNLLDKIKRKAKKWHIEGIYENNYKDARKLWQETNKLLRRKKKGSQEEIHIMIEGTLIMNKQEVANVLNEHFVNMGKKISDSFEANENFRKYLPPRTENAFDLKEINERQLETIINNMKAKTLSGFDMISNKLIKDAKDGLIKPLVDIINCSIRTGKVPHQWKIAKIIALFKGGDKKNKNNYRPISLLSAFSKLLEKSVQRQLYKYMEDKILIQEQFGFRAKRSTEMAIQNYMKNLLSNEKNEYRVSVFIDISKAFDSVSHRILIAKLEHLGIRGKALDWFKSYLADRYQTTVIGGKNSRTLKVTNGVPQGSILGPLLFLIYINDCLSSSKLLLTLFADDTTIQFSCKNLAVMQKIMNTELNKIAGWFADNALALHPGKTRFILYNARKNDELILKMCGVNIKRVGYNCEEKAFKFLGLYLDEKMDFKEHMKAI